MSTNQSNTFIIPAGEDTRSSISLKRVSSASDEKSVWEHEPEEGQLAVDIIDTSSELVVVATMAGTDPQDIELHLHNDFLTIRGERRPPVGSVTYYFYQECYWGKFSRTIVLPVDVENTMVRAEYRQGILLVYLPKVATRRAIPLLVIDE